MPQLCIDGREVEVPAGATILDAAKRLGIDVPTLCYFPGYKASTSCQVCLVKWTDIGRYIPSCGTKAVDGMKIESETPEVHHVRRTALELIFSDHVGDCVAPCDCACPAHMDVPQMLREISRQDPHSAIVTIKADIALPAILGRVCPKPCEKGCRRSAGDGPVEVCDLKRYVADIDLASPTPYRPPCAADSGKRVAIVGAGPAGLAAAFHLRQAGHGVTLFDANERPGGRLWTEFPESELPRETLVAEVGLIMGMDVAWRPQTRLGQDVTLEQLRADFDAVLLACGAIDRAAVQPWGVRVAKNGIEVHHGTFATSVPGVFAAGNALRGRGLVVRSVADGKEAAGVIHEFVSGQPLTPIHRPFSSRMGKLLDGELPEFLAAAAGAPRREGAITEPAAFSLADAAHQADRCFGCDCPAHGNCRLEHYAALYGVDTGKYQGARRAFVRVNREGAVIYEPGKCINCELCIQIAAQSKDAFGLAFVGRGFDVRVGVPFGQTMEEALGDVAAQCVEACPTGALYFSRRPPLVQLTLGGCGHAGCPHSGQPAGMMR